MAKAMRIRKDDQVVGDRRQGRRQDRPRGADRAEEAPRLRRAPEHDQAPRTAALGPGRDQKAAQVGGIVEKEGPIHVSNVMLLDPKDNKPTRVGVRRDKGGKRERFAKRSGASF